MAKKRKSREFLTPYVGGEFNLAGAKLTYRKQVLPLTTIQYEGRPLKFDRDMHQKLISAFQDRAYDQVPFVLADPDNRHNEYAENFRGVVRDLTLEQPGEAPGLYATIEFPNKRAARSVLDNAELGVSCRLREMVEKSDGRQYDIALRHVCGTLDPKVTGMSPWERVDLSDSSYSSARTVVDLTSATYQEDKMPKTKKRGGDRKTVDLAQLAADIEDMDNDELREFIDQQLADLSDPVDDDQDDTDDDTDDGEDDVLPPPPDADDDDEDDEDDEDEDESDLTDEARIVIDLANSRAAAAQANADRALQMLADQRWESEQERLLQAGVPKEIVDLAEPFFHVKEPMFVDLTDGRQLNASSRVKKIVEKMTGYLTLDGPKGHGVDLSEPEGKTAKDKAVLDQWSSEYGD